MDKEEIKEFLDSVYEFSKTFAKFGVNQKAIENIILGQIDSGFRIVDLNEFTQQIKEKRND